MPDVFNSEDNSNPIDQLVGEGKKFKTVEDLARGYDASQAHITKIEGENAGFRQEISTRSSVEDQLNRYAESQRTREQAPQGDTRREPEQPQRLSQEDFDKRVREVINDTTNRNRQQTNLSEVVDTLVDVHGDETKAREAVQRKAQEIGMTVEDLQNLASRSPKAAYELFGIDKSRPTTQSPGTRGNVNPQALGSGNRTVEGTKRYYDQMRRDNPALYNMPETQARRMKDAQRLGDAFFE